jgi:hypothetical protein
VGPDEEEEEEKFINQEIKCNMKGFEKRCISNAMDGTGDDMLWNGNEEVVDVRSECQEDEGTDCKHGDRNTDW